MFLYAARNADAAAALREAGSLVADDPGSPAARVVHSCTAWLCLFERDYDEAIALATRCSTRPSATATWPRG